MSHFSQIGKLLLTTNVGIITLPPEQHVQMGQVPVFKESWTPVSFEIWDKSIISIVMCRHFKNPLQKSNTTFHHPLTDLICLATFHPRYHSSNANIQKYTTTQISVPMQQQCVKRIAEYPALWVDDESKAMVLLHRNNIDGLVHERRNSSAWAMELHLSCTNPSICVCINSSGAEAEIFRKK